MCRPFLPGEHWRGQRRSWLRWKWGWCHPFWWTSSSCWSSCRLVGDTPWRRDLGGSTSDKNETKKCIFYTQVKRKHNQSSSTASTAWSDVFHNQPISTLVPVMDVSNLPLSCCLSTPGSCTWPQPQWDARLLANSWETTRFLQPHPRPAIRQPPGWSSDFSTK